jgi:DNA-binding Lrp family transcriptional regulator
MLAPCCSHLPRRRLGHPRQIRHRHPRRAAGRRPADQCRAGPARGPVGRALLAPRARLEEAGYIKGYRAEIDRHKIGLGVLAFVRLDAERNGDATRRLEEALQQLPEVISCHYISGTGTFELQVVAQDLDSFSRFALKSLINLPNVKDLHTSFSLGEVKASSALPLAHLKPAPGKAGAR